jgi:transposase InsO family protein
MGKAATEQEKLRQAKARLRRIQHYEQVTHNVSQTCRFFGVSRRQFYTWLKRYREHGLEGLKNLKSGSRKPHLATPPHIVALILRVRAERQYGPIRICLYLQRFHQVYVSVPTIYKILKRHGVPRVSMKRYRPGPRRRREFTVPGQSVQVDVKHLKLGGRRFYQFTAVDEATRYRVLRIYTHSSIPNAIAFLDEVRQRLPMAIQRVQTDHGNEFGTDFTWHLRDLGIAHRRIPPGCPEVNGKVERSHRTDGEEFYRRTIFRTPGELAAKLRRWEHEYNHQRPHLALAGKTPAERMCELKITARTAQAMA